MIDISNFSYVAIGTHGDIEWIISEYDPVKFSFLTLGLSLINPLYYGNESLNRNKISAEKVKAGILVSTDVLVFEVKPEVLKIHFEEDGHKVFNRFIMYLRYVSSQFATGFLDPVSSFQLFYEPPKKIEIESFDKMFRRRNLMHFLKWKDLLEIETYFKINFEIPVYEEVLIDSLTALYSSDYKKTILYAAIAIESMMSMKIDEEHNQSLQIVSKRTIDIKANGKTGVVRKDPIFESLRHNCSFKNLLHEVALYVLEKSLLDQNEALYQKAIQLYSTRNRIVHKGGLTLQEAEKLLTVNDQGASEAYNTAVEIFHWMGIKKFKKYEKSSGFVPF